MIPFQLILDHIGQRLIATPPREEIGRDVRGPTDVRRDGRRRGEDGDGGRAVFADLGRTEEVKVAKGRVCELVQDASVAHGGRLRHASWVAEREERKKKWA